MSSNLRSCQRNVFHRCCVGDILIASGGAAAIYCFCVVCLINNTFFVHHILNKHYIFIIILTISVVTHKKYTSIIIDKVSFEHLLSFRQLQQYYINVFSKRTCIHDFVNICLLKHKLIIISSFIFVHTRITLCVLTVDVSTINTQVLILESCS